MVESRQVYMDHGATTPLREEALEAMLPYLKEKYGNPSSIHSAGREARKAVNEAREKTARALGADPGEIYFTSGGTESNNMAIRGSARLKGKGRIITSAIEHHAVLDVCKDLEKDGFDVVFLPVDRYGMVDPRAVEEAMVPGTFLVSIMMANNEVGTIQPIREICALARERGVLVHTDAVQCVGQLPVDVKELQVDFLTLSAHKFNGPKGIGALYVRKGIPLAPLYRGGGQESKLRPGTENVAGIVGLGRALELAVGGCRRDCSPAEAARSPDCRADQLGRGYLKRPPAAAPAGNVNLSFHYIEGESLLLSLDLQGWRPRAARPAPQAPLILPMC